MRCFVAIELPTDVRERLVALQERLSTLGRWVRWTRAEQIHLTLNFLGEVPDAQVAGVCAAAQQITAQHQPFALKIGGVGSFPPRPPARVIWAGVIESPPMLLKLQHALEEGFGRLGFPPEQRAYRPHLTIGRVQGTIHTGRLRDALEPEEKFSAGELVVEEVTVFQSNLGPAGTVHVPMARARFAK